MNSIATFVLVAVTAMLPAIPAGAGEIRRSEILLAGQQAGFQTVETGSEGTVAVRYEFADRGRGPAIDAEYRVADDGTLTAVTITGVSYTKAPVDESFGIEAATATWHSTRDAGTAELTGAAHYLALENTPEEKAILARALLRSEHGELAILPSGRARIETLASRRFDDRELTLYAIHGIALSPERLWLDENLAHVASISSWMAAIADEDRDLLPRLTQAQESILAEQASAQARGLTTRLDTPLLIRNVRAFDPGDLSIRNSDVLVVDGRIADIRAGIDAPTGARELDGQGRFLMPGLWDMHVHLGSADGLLHMGSGVTTVRDMANRDELLERLETGYEDGSLIGPRIIKAGILDGGGPFAGPTPARIDDSGQLRTWIDRYADNGYAQIKLYSSLPVALVPEAIELAHARGMRVSGHVPVGMNAERFVALGADEIQHINFVFLNFLAGPDDDTRTPLRLTALADRGVDLDLSGARVHAFIEQLKQAGTVVDPTLMVFESLLTDQPGHPSSALAAVRQRMPSSWQRAYSAGGGGLPAETSGDALRYRQSLERSIEMVGLLHRSGVALVAGTDNMAGISFARELELYVRAGIPPAEVLRIATLNAARAMGRDGDHGRLAVGQVADLILVDGDPATVISDIRRVDTVIRGDRLFDAEALYRAAGLGPRQDASGARAQ